MKTPAPEQPVANSVEILLRNQRKGKMLTELSEQMQAVANAAREHGKSAVLILTLTVTPANGDATAMSVSDEIKVKLPQPSKPSSLFFVEEDGRLVRDDPHQSEMKLEAVAKTPESSNPGREAVAG